MPDDRKISVSYVSEVMPTGGNDLYKSGVHPGMKDLNQKILRIQVLQVVLGITLIVISAVSLIQERTLLGLGFSLISACMSLLAAVLGMQNWNVKIGASLNVLALISLLPALYFTILRLDEYFTKSTTTANSNSGTEFPYRSTDDYTTVILCWLVLLHVIPLGVSFIYNLVLFRHVHTYQLI